MKCIYIFSENTQILCLTESLAKECKNVQPGCPVDMDLLATVELIFKSPSCLSGSFLLESERQDVCTSNHHGVDIEKAARVFKYVEEIQNDSLKTLVCLYQSALLFCYLKLFL